jgi:hypothetical protein
MTITATLRLPIAGRETAPADARRVESLLRDLAYHPERHLSADGDQTLAELVRQKREWIAQVPTPETAKQRCHRIRDANQRMQPYLSDQWQQALEARARIESDERAQAILASRDYAFCLHPEEPLRQLMAMPAAEQ